MSASMQQVGDRRAVVAPQIGSAPVGAGRGVSVERRFTRRGQDPLVGMKFERRRSVITNPDGSVVFKMDDVEVPASWSQLATDILVSKYFRKAEVPGTGHETSARQVVERIVKAIRQAGDHLGGYFATPDDAQAFEDELVYMLMNQIGAFNSPVWFNCGLKEAYGIAGKPVGSWVWDPATNEVRESADAYTNPQVSACFIQSVDDDLMDIAEGIQREMRLFKFGSGTGSNFSRIRAEGEKLTSGGTSSGLMSFLEIYDKSAGAIKSGGTTRRAAKMVCLDMDHPDIVRFIEWKAREEDKVRALIKAGYSSDFNGEAYRTVSGQNSNNSVRVTDEFMQAVIDDKDWSTTWRTNGKVAKTYRARDLMRKIGEAAWRCADPGVQYDTTCNAWHTVPAAGKINATNPCSEFVFLDDTACNLASLNLLKFLKDEQRFDVDAYRHACRTFIIAQEILVDYASYPTKRIAQRSHDYRPLGLGYANLGSMLLVLGQPYDSAQARAIGGSITAIMNGAAYEASAEIAASKGPFPGFAHNREPMLKVMNMHRDAAYRLDTGAATALPGTPPVDSTLIDAARVAWDRAVAAGMRYGYRNAQATVLAPTGTIGLLMDCDTTGIEPDFALVKFKKLAGGGSFKIVNQTVSRALKNLGYTTREIDDIVAYMRGTWSLEATPHVNRAALLAKGLLPAEVDKAEQALPSAFDLRHVFSKHVVGEEAFRRLGFAERLSDPTFDLLRALGFTDAQVEAAAEVTSGRLTIEGAPHLRPEHLPIFDCANRCGKTGVRSIAPMGHVRMMAAAQPFLSGAISKTVNLPEETSIEEIERIYLEGWRLGLKAIAIYRDGSKRSQPLSTGKKKDSSADASTPTAAAAADLGLGGEPKPYRRRLPAERSALTHKFDINGHEGYITVGLYPDGQPGEIFLKMAKEGSTVSGLMDTLATSISLALQYGVPLRDLVNKFAHVRFEPAGFTANPEIPIAKSLVDYIFRWLGSRFLAPEEKAGLGLIDRNALVDEPPAGGFVLGQPMTLAPAPRAGISLDAPAPATPTPAAPVQGSGASTAESLLAAEAPASTPATNAPATPTVPASTPLPVVEPATNGHANGNGKTNGAASAISLSLGRPTAFKIQEDAPSCAECGSIMVRNGSCYKCLNCGSTSGCS